MHKMCSEDRYNFASLPNETQPFHLNSSRISNTKMKWVWYFSISIKLMAIYTQVKSLTHSLHYPSTAARLLLWDQWVLLSLNSGITFFLYFCCYYFLTSQSISTLAGKYWQLIALWFQGSRNRLTPILHWEIDVWMRLSDSIQKKEAGPLAWSRHLLHKRRMDYCF